MIIRFQIKMYVLQSVTVSHVFLNCCIVSPASHSAKNDFKYVTAVLERPVKNTLTFYLLLTLIYAVTEVEFTNILEDSLHALLLEQIHMAFYFLIRINSFVLYVI